MNKYTYNIAFILLSTMSLSIFAQSQLSVYKWVDEEKNIHYTDRPAPGKIKEQDIEQKIRKAAGLPAKQKAEEITRQYEAEKEVEQPQIAPVPPKNTEKSTKEQIEKQKESAEAYAKKLASYCKQQTQNLETLQKDTPIAWEEQGQTILLSPEQRTTKVNTIQAIIKDKCATKK